MKTELSSLDTLFVTSQAQALSSEWPVTSFCRAIEGLPKQDESQKIQWSIRGKKDSAGHRLLQVKLSGPVLMECQRCLKVFSYQVETENTFLVVTDKAELELEDDDPESLERILASRSFNGFDLLEDELILSLPYIARHEQCPSLPKALQISKKNQVPSTKENPFKVLKELKKDRD